jgi:small subunit ribosomal protein S4
MARYTGPVTRISRRLGIILFGNGASKAKAFHKKRYKPGMHGQKMSGKPSEYGKQLMEKQKAKFMYGISEKQSQMYYTKAKKSKDTTSDAYFKLLEQRVDNVVFRAGFAASRPQARQMISHGLFTLNGVKITVPSISVKESDKLEVKNTRKESALFTEVKNQKSQSPAWLKVDNKNLSVEIIRIPEANEIDSLQQINPQLIVEYYSK